MWPLGGLIRGASNELKVPGQDAPATITDFSGWPGTAVAGIYVNRTTGGASSDGRLSRRQGANYIPYTNMWIHSDVRAQTDPADYEFRFVNVTGQTGEIIGSPFEGTSYGAEDGWINGSLDPNWRVTATGGQFDFEQVTVSGLIQVREIADTSNIRTGDLTLTATFEGQS